MEYEYKIVKLESDDVRLDLWYGAVSGCLRRRDGRLVVRISLSSVLCLQHKVQLEQK